MDETNQPVVSVEEELADLKQKADILGVKYSSKIGVDALREKVREKLEENSKIDEYTPAHIVINEAKKEALKLIRCRIVNRDPNKMDLAGGIITCGAPNVGIVRKWIPYHGYDDGYHIPQIIYNFLSTKKYLRVWNVPDPEHRGNTITKSAFEREFDITILPPLTQEELNQLAAEQKATGMV